MTIMGDFNGDHSVEISFLMVYLFARYKPNWYNLFITMRIHFIVPKTCFFNIIYGFNWSK